MLPPLPEPLSAAAAGDGAAGPAGGTEPDPLEALVGGPPSSCRSHIFTHA